jgi:hypothetical protein
VIALVLMLHSKVQVVRVLHFEIFCEYVMKTGTRYRINPGYFIPYKHHSEQSEAEKKEQLDEFNLVKTVQVDGVVKLSANNLF